MDAIISEQANIIRRLITIQARKELILCHMLKLLRMKLDYVSVFGLKPTIKRRQSWPQ